MLSLKLLALSRHFKFFTKSNAELATIETALRWGSARLASSSLLCMHSDTLPSSSTTTSSSSSCSLSSAKISHLGNSDYKNDSNDTSSTNRLDSELLLLHALRLEEAIQMKLNEPQNKKGVNDSGDYRHDDIDIDMLDDLEKMNLNYRILEKEEEEKEGEEGIDKKKQPKQWHWLSREQLFLKQKMKISKTVEKLYTRLIDQRMAGEPIAYIMGYKEFWKYKFLVSRATLIPRPETETLVETAISLYATRPSPKRVLDIGTGSGCLLVSLLAEATFKGAAGMGLDVNEAALHIATLNAKRILNNASTRTTFVKSDWLSVFDSGQVEGGFDLLVSNPPYIPTSVLPALPPTVKLYEPKWSLDGGVDGLACYRALAEALRMRLPQLLNPGAFLLFEIGYAQAKPVEDIFRLHLPRVKVQEVVNDLNGIARCLVFRYQ
jgi:release factor glutamine methyltransferase